MNTRLLFVATLLIVGTMAVEWSTEDDQLFSDIIHVDPVHPSQAQPVVVAQTINNQVPVYVSGNLVHGVVIQQQQPSEEEVAAAHRRARAAAYRAHQEAQELVNAATASKDARDAAKERVDSLTNQLSASDAALAKATHEAQEAIKAGASVEVMEKALEEVRKVNRDLKERLTQASEELKNAVKAADLTRAEALRRLAENERIARDQRLARRKAEEEARMARRKAAAEARRLAHDDAVRHILEDAQNATKAAHERANTPKLQRDLEETRRAIRDLKIRILNKKAQEAAQRRAELEKKLQEARTLAASLAREISTINVPQQIPIPVYNNGTAVLVPVVPMEVSLPPIVPPAYNYSLNASSHQASFSFPGRVARKPRMIIPEPPKVQMIVPIIDGQQPEPVQQLNLVRAQIVDAHQAIAEVQNHEVLLHRAINNDLTNKQFEDVFAATMSLN